MTPTVRELRKLSLMVIMDRWPQTLPVFMQNRMLCVGCTIAPFHTIGDACREHDLDEDSIVGELMAVLTLPQ